VGGRAISNTPSGYLAWSPDGSELAFVGEHEGAQRVFIVDVARGIQRMASESEVWTHAGLSWCRTGTILFVTPGRRELVSLEPSQGTETVIPKDSLLTAIFPVCSPDGAEVAVFGEGASQELGLHIIDLRTGEDRSVFEHELAFPHTWPEGGWIYSQDFVLPEDGGTPRGVYFPTSVISLGSARSFNEISRDRAWALTTISNPTSSDIFLIEYEDAGIQ